MKTAIIISNLIPDHKVNLALILYYDLNIILLTGG